MFFEAQAKKPRQSATARHKNVIALHVSGSTEHILPCPNRCSRKQTSISATFPFACGISAPLAVPRNDRCHATDEACTSIIAIIIQYEGKVKICFDIFAFFSTKPDIFQNKSAKQPYLHAKTQKMHSAKTKRQRDKRRLPQTKRRPKATAMQGRFFDNAAQTEKTRPCATRAP